MYLKIKFGPFHSCYLYINSDCCQVCLVRGHWEDRRREVVSPLEENLLQPSLKLAPVSSHQLSKVGVNYISKLTEFRSYNINTVSRHGSCVLAGLHHVRPGGEPRGELQPSLPTQTHRLPHRVLPQGRENFLNTNFHLL